MLRGVSVRPEFMPDSGERLPPLGGVNGRYPPRFMIDSGEAGPVAPRLPKLPTSRFGIPALGRAILLLLWLRAANSLERPPAGIPPT